MADILPNNNFGCIFVNENDKIVIQISMKFVSRSQLTITSIDSGNGLSPVRRQAIAWNNADSVHCAALGGDESNDISVNM